jgi:SNF2 family DNA or RNA helicase
MTALMEEIEEAREGDKKVIVWARFVRDLDEIYEKLRGTAVRYYGKVPEKERIAAMQTFQQDDRVKIFVGHVQTAGEGLTLSAAESIIYHSNVSSLDLRLQSEDRAEAPGKKSGTVITDIEAHRSIDQKIINSMRKQKSLADQINRDPISLFMEEEE